MSNETHEIGAAITRTEAYKKRCEHITALCEIYADRTIAALDPNVLAQTTIKLDTLLSTYPLLFSTIKHYLMSVLSPDPNSTQKRPQSLLLLGPSGVGKTHFIQQFSQALDFALAHISCKEFSTPDFYCYNSYAYDVNEFSEIAKAIWQHNRSNKPGYLIICMDELDKQIQKNEAGVFDLNKTPGLYKSLLHMTDSNSTTYFDRTVNAHLDLTKVIVVILANSDFVYKTPLNRRLKKIQFPALTPQIKQQIATKKIQDLCKQKNLELDTLEYKFLQNMIASDQLPGAGQLLEEIEIFLAALKNASSFDNTSWKISSKELLISFTREMYQRKSAEWLEKIDTETESQTKTNAEQPKLTFHSRRHSF